MANEYIYSDKWKGWRAWVKYKGGDVKEYDKMVKRFQRSERYMKDLRYVNQYGKDIEYNPQRLAAYSAVYGDEKNPYIYEKIRAHIVKNKVYNDKDAIERIEAKYRTERFRELYGNIIVDGKTLNAWYKNFMAGKISLAEYNNVIIDVRRSADYKTKSPDGGDY